MDTACSATCAGDAVPVEVTFNESVLVDLTATVQLSEYKVEYKLDGTPAEVPYFAAASLDQSLAVGDTAVFDIRIAGSVQRASLSSLAAGQPMSGTATLTFAGYDWNDDLHSAHQGRAGGLRRLRGLHSFRWRHGHVGHRGDEVTRHRASLVSSWTPLALGSLALASLAGVACTSSNGDSGSLAALPDWSAGYDPDTSNGAGGSVVVTDFGLLAPTDVNYPNYLHKKGDWSAPCVITPGETAAGYQHIDCTMDMDELDLFFQGLAFDFTVPADTCDYAVWHHYQYEAWEVGQGPTVVSVTTDANGNVVSEKNAVNGQPYCQYDYSAGGTGDPNCCLGNYVMYTTNASGVTSVSLSTSWGGRASTCYAGAAFDDPEAVFDLDGWPVSTFVPLTNQGNFAKRFQFDGLSSKYSTNVNLANYYEPADHDGTMPAGFTGDYVVPNYVFLCYDHAEELLGEIDLSVQEWNEQDQLMADGTGDPNTVGTEPITGLPLDDREDWATATPGSATWIQDGQ